RPNQVGGPHRPAGGSGPAAVPRAVDRARRRPEPGQGRGHRADRQGSGDAFGGDGFHGRRCQRPARAAQGGFFLRALRRGAGSAARGGLGVEEARRPRCSARAVRVAPRCPGIVAAAGRRAQAPASGMTAPRQKKNNFFFAGGWEKRVRRELRVRALLWALPLLRRAPLWVGSLLGTLAWYL